MNSTGLPPPKSLLFSGNLAENFRLFEQSFSIYISALGLETTSKKRQANILLHVIGEEAITVFNGFTFNDEEDKNDPKLIIDEFRKYCTPRKNLTFERGKFNTRIQQKGERFDKFYSDVCNLAKSCEYGTMTEELIKDKISSGVCDIHLKTVLMSKDITLVKALSMCRAHEVTREQIGALDSLQLTPSASVSQVTSSTPSRQATRGRYRGGSARGAHGSSNPKRVFNRFASGSQSDKCTYCGHEKHDRQACPARNVICRKCNKRGHYASVCLSTKKTVHYMYTEEAHTQENTNEFLGAVHSNLVESQSCWQRAIDLNGSKVIFKIDTGADVTCISQRLYESRYKHIALKQQHSHLNGPDDTPLPVSGCFEATLTYKHISVTEKIYVLQGRNALLSRKASVALNIVKLVGSISLPQTGSTDYKKRFSNLFRGIGKLEGAYNIKIEDGAVPYSVGAPRRVPLPLMSKVKEELDRLESMKVIRRVETPTDWCAPIVVVPKANQSKIRLCVDLTRLNKVVRRERHILPSVDHTLGQLAGAKIFTKLDANSGFHQIELSKASTLLTTFITPFGRYCYQRLPFGINSGPEHFQKRIAQMLEGLTGVVYLMDDIVVFGANTQEHNERLDAVLTRLETTGITLNSDKCVFATKEIHFLGHIVSESGVSVDPDKVSGIRDMTPPTNITELRRFLGMTNQLMKFVPHLTDTTAPLRQLLGKDTEWLWDVQQQKSFMEVKHIITQSPVLALYDSSLDIKVSADSSSYGLGGVISQYDSRSNGWRPIAYASRSLTPTEGRYAQIEKEALASTWACEKFQDFLIGKTFLLETDHKPLVSLLGQKDIHELSPRIQRFRMRLMRYSFTVQHVPGKELYTADTLSRAPCEKSTSQDRDLEEDTQAYVAMICQNLPATDQRLNEIRLHQVQDETCSVLRKYVEDGWPDRTCITGMMHQYWPHKDSITMQQDILMFEARIIIPSSLRLDILDRIHQGHQGISKCRERAKQSVWWPGLSRQIGDLVEQCRMCCKNKLNTVEPLICSDIPDHPWHTVATDLFEYQQQKYLLLVDCYSRYIEVAKLDRTHSSDIINHTKSIFARHGIPVSVHSDNGPQYSAAEFTAFSKQYGFNHITSSPGHASGNGAAERAVRTIKDLMKGSGDLYLSLLNYRATPLANGYSPAELLMSRKLRTTLPATTVHLQSKAPDQDRFNRCELSQRIKQKTNFDRAHVATSLSTLPTGQEVWLPDRQQFGSVAKQQTERSYVVQTPTGVYRRNRVQLNKMPSVPDTITPSGDPSSAPPETEVHQPSVTVTRSGRMVNKPARFREEE